MCFICLKIIPLALLLSSVMASAKTLSECEFTLAAPAPKTSLNGRAVEVVYDHQRLEILFPLPMDARRFANFYKLLFTEKDVEVNEARIKQHPYFRLIGGDWVKERRYTINARNVLIHHEPAIKFVRDEQGF